MPMVPAAADRRRLLVTAHKDADAAAVHALQVRGSVVAVVAKARAASKVGKAKAKAEKAAVGASFFASRGVAGRDRGFQYPVSIHP